MPEVKLLPEYSPELAQELYQSLEQWNTEVSDLLPSLPSHIRVQFDNRYLILGFGTGGTALSKDTMALAYNPNYDDQDVLVAELKSTYFQEAYHLARGYYKNPKIKNVPDLKKAVEEGAAAKFASMRAGSSTSNVKNEDRDVMLAWVEDMKNFRSPRDYNWRQWTFLNAATKRKWVRYKVGSFIVDEALQKNPKHTIESISLISSRGILALADL